MKKNKVIKILLTLLLVSVLGSFVYGKFTDASSTVSPTSSEYKHLKQRADSAEVYCRANGFNTDYCFLVDFSIHSGKKRFFVWDFKGDSVKYSSLCAHGHGGNSTASKPEFSNVDGSFCSSLGRYKVGIRSHSKWGINVHYKLHGLEPTNSNAYQRIVVLHSFTPVPGMEIYPVHLPMGMSKGCPVICNQVMKQVDALLEAEEKPLLLWIYN